MLLNQQDQRFERSEARQHALDVVRNYINSQGLCDILSIPYPTKEKIPVNELHQLITLLIKSNDYDVVECLVNSDDFCNGNFANLISMFFSFDSKEKKEQVSNLIAKTIIEKAMDFSKYSIDDLLEWAFEIQRNDYLTAFKQKNNCLYG